jgi:hypothetical protein
MAGIEAASEIKPIIAGGGDVQAPRCQQTSAGVAVFRLTRHFAVSSPLW